MSWYPDMQRTLHGMIEHRPLPAKGKKNCGNPDNPVDVMVSNGETVAD
jgi:hypothetical protein